MAMSDPASRGDFHAILREVEPGLFRAEYEGEINPDNPDARRIPDYHVDTSIDAVRLWVEQMALSMGYARVVWDETPPRR